ncbi:MAG: hypothetical protein L3J35_04970 [Bacteroidales bacterium]|nr:hypothetical protein [Bacteroidales bacterium]
MRNKLHLIYILLLFSQISFSQDIFNTENSIIYANHLFKVRDFNSAVKEYEQLLNIFPENEEYFNRLILSYLNLNKPSVAVNKIKDKFGEDFKSYSVDILKSYIQLLILSEQYKLCRKVIKEQTQLSKQERAEYVLALLLIEHKSKDAKGFINTVTRFGNPGVKFTELSELYENKKKVKYKNPILASVLSIIIPGLGKIYSNDTKNGVSNFSIIGLYTWQSYRGFKLESIKSVYGWGFGALATGFYIGNIFGAAESAKRENNFNNRKVKEKVIQIISD